MKATHSDIKYGAACLVLMLLLGLNRCSAQTRTEPYTSDDVLITLGCSIAFVLILWFVGGVFLIIKQAYEKEFNTNHNQKNHEKSNL